MATERRVSWIITANIKNWSKNLDKAARRMDRFGRKMQRAGRSLTQNITVPLGIAAGASIKMAADFEQSMSKIEGLVGVARSEVQGMRDDVLRLAGQTAQSPQDLADALFFVTSAGLRGAEAIEVLEASGKAAAAGLGETKVVADLVTSAINAYGSENLSAAEATDTLVAAVREGKAEAPDLAAALGQVLPVASEMGVEFNEVGAAVAAMTRTGTDAATASTQLRQIIFKLLKPAAESEKAFRKMGTSGAELRKQLREEGLISVLGFLKDQMKDNEQAMAQAFPRVQALAGALDIMGSNAEENRKIFERMTDNTGALDKAFDAAYQTTAFKFDQALSNLQNTAIELGASLLPLVNQGLEFVNKWVKAFSRMSTESKVELMKIAGLMAAGGPVAFAMGSLIRLIASLIRFASTAFTTLRLIVTSSFLPILAAFMTGVAVGQALIDVWNTLAMNGKSVFISLENSAKRGMSKVADSAMDWANDMLSEFDEVTGGISFMEDKLEDFKNLWKDLQGMGLPSVGGETTRKAGPEMKSAATPGLNINVKPALKGLEKLKAATTEYASISEAALDGISTGWAEFVTDFQSAGQAFNDFMVNQVSSAFISLSESIGKSLAGAGNEFKSGLQVIMSLVLDFAKQLGGILIGIGSAIMIIPGLQGPAGLYIAGGSALVALASAGQAMIQKSVDRKRERSQSVGDALIRSDGSIVEFHPDDNILAMKDFGNLQGSTGAMSINIPVYLNNRQIALATGEYNDSLKR